MTIWFPAEKQKTEQGLKLVKERGEIFENDKDGKFE